MPIILTLFRWFAGLLWFCFLTLLTQIGGIVWLVTLPIGLRLSRRFPQFYGLKLLLFLLFYVFATVAIVPPVASRFGRVPLPVLSNPHLKPESLWFAFLNRHYVKPGLRTALETVAAQMQVAYPGATIWYMDANFPFIDGYPLEPHFSHKDGKKVDLSFYWREKQSKQCYSGSPSAIGYGACAVPLPGEYDYNADCEKQGYWYISLDRDIAEYFFNPENYTFDADRTRELLCLLAEHPSVHKILIQPHLKQRLDLEQKSKIRAQGCKAARHDDHAHVELR
jgi:hypothetical protein